METIGNITDEAVQKYIKNKQKNQEKKIQEVPLYSGPVKMLVTPPFGASSNIALWRAYSKPPVELVVADLEFLYDNLGRYKIFMDEIIDSLSIKN